MKMRAPAGRRAMLGEGQDHWSAQTPPPMKTPFIIVKRPETAIVLLAAGFLGTSITPCHAQTVQRIKEDQTVTRETKVDGRLHLTGPESIAIQTGTANPTTYRYGNTVQFVDDAGVVVARDQIVPGTPVTVYTVPQSAGGLITNRIVVHKSTVTTPTPGGGQTVTTAVTETTQERTNVKGVLLEKEPDRVLVKTEQEGNVTFRYSQVTDFIDAEGKHVDLINIVPGLPVQIDFRQVGDRLEASRVIVRGRVRD